MLTCLSGLRIIAVALVTMIALLASGARATDPETLGSGEIIPESLRPEDRRSGTTFLSESLRAQQADEGANPGMLWVATGESLWSTPAGPEGKSCASCHGDAETSMKGVAARYPMVDKATGELLNVELRINQCRRERQGAEPFAYESNELLGLTAFIAYQSRGMPISVSVDGPAASHFEAGRKLFTMRQGQLNLACTQCHDENWGRKLRGDTISQGHPTGFPIYRLEWQSLGSLHRRLRACSLGVRAEVLDYGSPEYLALELYLAWRARGMPMETPAIRR
jgi:sulfur-oxidizing protein SoxA